uniref:ZU5 domain-containing protein n=1 Tax=Mesocestoides corti TaxID=53468 RepID=A0A5K3FWK2_MESCO
MQFYVIVLRVCSLVEVGPVGVRFNAPILMEIPYCASLNNNQREIVVLRSENGETWKEHPMDPTDQAVQDSLGEYFADAIPSSELRERRVHRILTNTIPQYFALVTRCRQDLVLVGPEGCVMTSTVDPQVQVTFPPGALQKKIRVGLQVHPVDASLVAACLGSPRIAVSPIVTIEPRRRKFHRPITVSIPLPFVSSQQQQQQQQKSPVDLSTVRLLCSITGGTAPAIWEDITGSSPFSLQKNCVSFTTTVSARLWLIDCPNLSEVSEMATRVYREATAVPYLGQFVVYARRHHPEEAQIRCVCLTDDTEQKTLECQEGFEVVARGPPNLVEFLHDRPVWIETAGNLVPVAGQACDASGATGDHQMRFASVRAFEENRLNMLIRIKDLNGPPAGQLAFMPQQRQPGGVSVLPLCVVDLMLPRMSTPKIGESNQHSSLGERTSLVNGVLKHGSSEEELVESIARSDLDVKKVAENLGADWTRLAPHLGLTQDDVNAIHASAGGFDNDYKKALTCLSLWQERFGPRASGTALAAALRQVGREDVLRQSMQNISLVQNDRELSHALRSLEAEEAENEDAMDSSLYVENDYYPEKEDQREPAPDGDVIESTICVRTTPVEAVAHTTAAATTKEERQAALGELADQLDFDSVDVAAASTPGPYSGEGVDEEVLVAEKAQRSNDVESAVPAILMDQIEADDSAASSLPVESEPHSAAADAAVGDTTSSSAPLDGTTRSPDLSSTCTENKDLRKPTAEAPECRPLASGVSVRSSHRPHETFTHLSFTRSACPNQSLPPTGHFTPKIPSHVTGVEVTSAGGTQTYRADLETREGSVISTDTDPIISGEFVLTRQAFDDSNTPRVQQDTEMVIPVPLHETGRLNAHHLIGPGVCRVTTESRQQVVLGGHYRLRRSSLNRRRHERPVEEAAEVAEEDQPPEPPKRTTSLRSGSSSTLGSIGEKKKQANTGHQPANRPHASYLTPSRSPPSPLPNCRPHVCL